LKLYSAGMSAACCLLVAAIVAGACGGGGSKGTTSDVSKIATATLPAKLPDPKILTGGVVQNGSGSGRYTIKSGDTLSAIAATYGVSLDDLLAANPGIDPTGLRAGDTIRLHEGTGSSGAQPTAAPPTSPTAKGSTPAAQATQAPATEPPATDTPAAADTPTPAANTPEPGAATPTPMSLGQTYTVEAGDIPATIAEKFGVSVDALLAANPGIDPTNLHIGQVLIIPPKPAP
jgi:peptidoglycan DL-endopeptidase LytF